MSDQFKTETLEKNALDIFIIGGGINGSGIARDAAGRKLKVALAEMGDLGNATSSASTKLFHGGLRYLEYFEFSLVRESLKEREVLLAAMPHISWPLRFVIPYRSDMTFNSRTPMAKLLSFVLPWNKGRRPPWLLRAGLFLYDNIGGRKLLPPTKSINLQKEVSGIPLKKKFLRAFEYSDCWVDDARLVILNARDAKNKGAIILPRSKVISTKRTDAGWTIKVQNIQSGEEKVFQAKLLINAAGPWVQNVLNNILKINSPISVKLVRGSHIIIKKLYDHDKCYLLQGKDSRIVFLIPYERNFTLIGTTDFNHHSSDTAPVCSTEEKQYLLNFVQEYLETPLKPKDIVWSYSGMRPLYDDGSRSASAISRDYFLDLDLKMKNSPLLNIYGGKITTYRKLSEAALKKVRLFFPNMTGSWTDKSYLPGGDFKINGFNSLCKNIQDAHPYLHLDLINRLVRLYGTETSEMLSKKRKKRDLGTELANNVFSFEIDWVIEKEWVESVDDFVWRRTKLGLLLSKKELNSIERYIKTKIQNNDC
ncbi:MAG: glycerol-3-phosphate dehydrogenase [Gammaproteobacteria bacterium]|nr:glycerol-3-phosphate dehydrogenase [Gammaproteobacteria bacterium]